MSYIAKIFQPNIVAHDLFLMLTGGRVLGSGMSRTVYDWELADNAVVRFEEEGHHQNVIEWETWQRVRDTDMAKWFAPCLEISPCGRVLVQAMAKDLKGDLPKKVPAFFTDLKRDNWGKYKGRRVCRDYGIHLMLEKGMSGRMRKADWWQK